MMMMMMMIMVMIKIIIITELQKISCFFATDMTARKSKQKFGNVVQVV
jgi:hypothetical protein